MVRRGYEQWPTPVRLAIVLTLAAVAAGCGGDDAEVSAETIERAVIATSEAPGARLFVEGRFRLSSRRDEHRTRCRGRMDVRESTDLRCGGNPRRAIRIGPALYVLARRPEAMQWAKVTVVDFSWEAFALLYAADFEGLAHFARAAGIRDLGEDRVNGTSTRHYSATLAKSAVALLEPPHTVPGGLGYTEPADDDPMSVDFWIDERRLIRRTRLELRLDLHGDVTGVPPTRETIEFTTHYTEFKLQAPIMAPPALNVRPAR